MKPRIAITFGDPAGIGPEIVRKALRNVRVRASCHPLVIGAVPRRLAMGRPSRHSGRFAVESLRSALSLIAAGQADALVTAPVSKESFALADLSFPGHTEWLAHQAKTARVAMLMAAGPMRALLMTRHVPLARVARTLSAGIIEESAELAFAFARNVLGKPRVRLVACGLNPHAGDGGLLGREEQLIFRPALARLARRKIPVAGPISADSVFRDMARGKYDIALAAYHDQGMIPLKVFAPQKLVNITLGLPYIRTSPGHGTAYDIAGLGRADAGPMIEAILLAAQYASRTTP